MAKSGDDTGTETASLLRGDGGAIQRSGHSGQMR